MDGKQIFNRQKAMLNLIDGLYMEAVVLCDEARSYFDSAAAANDQRGTEGTDRAAFSHAALVAVTRLNQSIAELLNLRMAMERPAAVTPRDMGREQEPSPALPPLPVRAALIVEASLDVHARTRRLTAEMADDDDTGFRVAEPLAPPSFTA